jgi:hypothetical protein
MALDGLERVPKEKYPSRRPINSFGNKNPSVNFIQSADDFIVTSESRELLVTDVKPFDRAVPARSRA